MVPGSEHGSHYRISDPQATTMKPVSNCLEKDIHASGLLEVILQRWQFHKGADTDPAD